MYSKIQFISQGDGAETQKRHIATALDAGCNWVQLRFKNALPKEIAQVAHFAKKLCNRYHATFIINDNTVLAKELDADGVHLGLADMPITQAREILGINKIIGGTANTANDVWRRQQEGCNYIGLGPLRFTPTKKKLSPILGFEGYRQIIQQLPANNVPIYAIGGIATGDVEALSHMGIYGIAVSGLLINHHSPKTLIQQLNESFYDTLKNS